MDALLTALPAVTVPEEARSRVVHGQPIDAAPGASEWVRLMDGDGRLIAIARPGSRPGSLHPAVVLI
jgi:hypothetical protein